MDPSLKGLEPKLLWEHFDRIRQIPRCSKNEQKAIDYVISVAKRLGFPYKKDKAGNVVVSKPATKGHERAPTIVLQGHVDMVCEKNKETVFDFSKDAIELRREGDYLYAKGTTLGADNGIGVSAALAVLEDNKLVHGPIEALFTIDEETGLTGAFALAPDMLTGTMMMNLDSEEEGAIYVGCAGGGETDIYLPLKWERPEGKAFIVNFSGMKGGHSGVDIHLGRANAIKMLARILWKASHAGKVQLAGFSGGDKHNAIPREAEALVITAKDAGKVKKAIEEEAKAIMFEYRTLEPGMKLDMKDTDLPKKAVVKNDTEAMLDLLHALPHGVLRMSPDIGGLVETSTNLSKIVLAKEMHVHMSSRSSSRTQLESVRDRLEAMARLAGAKAVRGSSYPGWLPNLDSKVLAMLKKTALEIWGREPEIKAIHAGLETGIVGEKFPGMDMASIGPQIENPHSPDERVKVTSVPPFYKMLALTLKKLS